VPDCLPHQVRYLPGQQYREHCDWFSPTQDASCVARTRERGNRLVSIFACLQACERGGQTDFPRLGLRFELGLGEALLWMNVDRHGCLDGRTLHAGRPIDAGEKLGLNVWLRQRPSAGAVSSAAQQLLPGKAVRRAKTKGDASRAGEIQSRSGEIQSRVGEIQSRAGEIQDQSSSEGPSARAEHYAERAVPSAVPSTAPSAWRPSQPPPRPTLASPGAQLSDGLRERPW
jgi:hypothetical protein